MSTKKAKKAVVQPAALIADAAKALSPVEAMFVQRALAGEQVKSAIEALVADGAEADIDVTVRFQGHLKRGESGERKPTSRALRKATLALLVRRMGITRDAALELLSAVLVEAHSLGEDAEAKLLEERPEVGEAFGKVDALIETLPAILTSGRVTLSDVAVTRVLAPTVVEVSDTQ